MLYGNALPRIGVFSVMKAKKKSDIGEEVRFRLPGTEPKKGPVSRKNFCE